ncbi:Protein NRT1/ PTR FAMILY 2.7 [Hibiscus syriacus]|uniref:Protein NRT1/ PTR FAMILY 2.7 n=1 Tax=Hibiscus syriacus TaxID=106335 RepID=A0A6A2YMY1_HIBSY|nr:protein NRT1/ PTR FAMILY 2.7-like [Hibiscus syriacus]KAE8680701.1 Protein NRT1/ PTR FAMILY 2.7 [Hibiscus syriacus]
MSSTDQLQQSAVTATSTNGDSESLSHMLSSGRERGGWVTFFFISATLTGLMIAGWGWLTNLIVYLIEEFNVKSIDATQIANVVNGSINLIPIIGAVLADSFLGSFHVVSISSLFSLLGIIVLTLTATLSHLRPHCETDSSLCNGPSKLHLAVLYSGITLASIGLGVVRFILATLGANQFDNPQDQGRFFNWFFFTFYAACVVSSIGIVYVEDNISWGLGFGICAAFNFLGFIIFLLGNRFYRHDKPRGSPYTSLARVIVAAIRKRKVLVSSESKDYHHEINDEDGKSIATMPKRSFRFLNNAAMKTEGDINSDGSIAKPWRLCSVQQVEDLKTLVRISPLWASTVFLTTPIAIQNNMTVLQALAMDRHLGSDFKIPAGSITIVVLISSATFIALLDRFLYPNWKNLTGRSLTPLQKIGTGHVFNILSMAISAVVESKRLKTAHENHLQGQQGGTAAVVPMLALWLFPQLIVVGIGEAFHFPGNVSLYYQEFPVSMKSTATSMISIVVGVAFYVSATAVDLIRNVTGWLPDDINEGRLDSVYWIFVVLGLLNFGYFLLCAKLYRYQNLQ